jgi:hypothetical protein
VRVTRLACLVALALAAAIGCSDHPLLTQSSGPLRSEITPIYDSTGQPVSDYYSANSQISWSADSSFEPGGARYSKSYFEEYTWSTSHNQWDNHNTYSTGDQPFDSNPPPAVDVASVDMTFSVTSPAITERSGASVPLPSARPQLQSDTSNLATVHVPTAAPPMAIRSSPANTAGILLASPFSASAHRAAAIERLVVTPQTTTLVLQRLRSAFAEAAGDSGTLRFTQQRGVTQVNITFDLARGAITRTETPDNGQLLYRTDNQYDPIPGNGGWVLSEVKTTRFDASGRASRVTTQAISNVTVR